MAESTIKAVSQYDGAQWGAPVPIGADAENVDYVNEALNVTNAKQALDILSDRAKLATKEHPGQVQPGEHMEIDENGIIDVTRRGIMTALADNNEDGSLPGLSKLYNSEGDNVDGAITQKESTELFNRKLDLDLARRTITVTVDAANWSDSAPYTQTVTAPGVLEVDTPEIRPYIPAEATVEQEKAINKAAACVSYIDTIDDAIEITCIKAKPTTSFQVVIKGV